MAPATVAAEAAVPLTDSAAPSVQRGSRIVVFLALLTDYLLLTMPLPILPAELACNDDGTPHANKTGCVDDTWIFMLIASKAALQILANPFMGCAVDRYGPLRPLRFSLAVMAISTAGFSVGLWLNDGRADTVQVVFPILFVARAVQGLASGGVMTGGMTLVNMAHPESERGGAAGFVMAGMALGVLAGPVVGGVLTKVWSSWGAFLIIAALIVVAVVAQAVLLKDAAEHLDALQREVVAEEVPTRVQSGSFVGAAKGSISGSFVGSQASRSGSAAVLEGKAGTGAGEQTVSHSVYGDPLVLLVAACSLVSSMSIALLEPLVPLYLSRRPFFLSPFSQSLVWSSSTLAYMVSTPVAGLLADRLPEWSLLFGGLVLMALGAAGVVLIQQLWFTVIALLLVGAAMGFIDTPSSPLLAKIADLRGSSAYGRVFAVMDMATSLGFVVGPLLAAAIESQGLPLLFTTLPIALACLLFAPFTLGLRGVCADKDVSSELRTLD